MEYLTVGRIVKTIGLKGEVKIYPTTHFRDSRFSKGNHVFLLDEHNEPYRDLTIKLHHKNGNMDQVIFEEISSIDEAQTLVGLDLNVEKKQSFLKKDQYFFSDLEKMTVYFDNGTEIGKVKKVEEYSKYATLRIAHEPRDVLIPFVKAFIKSVDIEEKKIVVNYIEGLL